MVLTRGHVDRHVKLLGLLALKNGQYGVVIENSEDFVETRHCNKLCNTIALLFQKTSNHRPEVVLTTGKYRVMTGVSVQIFHSRRLHKGSLSCHQL